MFLIPLQVVPSDSQENGQTNEEEDVEKSEKEKQRRTSRDKRKNSISEEASETQISVKLDGEANKGKPPPWKIFCFLLLILYATFSIMPQAG